MIEFICKIFKDITHNYNNTIFRLFDENSDLQLKINNSGELDVENFKNLDKNNNCENNNYNNVVYKIIVDNKMYGFFDIISDKNREYIEKIGDLLLDLLKSKIKNHNLKKEWKLESDYNEAVIRSLNDGFLVLDKNGKVTHINDKALEILEVKRNKILNRELQNFFNSKLQVLEVLDSGKPIKNKELLVELHNGEKIHVLKNAIPVKNEENNVIAVIDRFKKIDKVHQFVSDIVGSNAKFTFNDIVYKNSRIKEIVNFAKNISKSSPTILIQGESGTGKELFAHAIHNCSYRQNNPFVIVDYASLPRELVESELFGYSDGAFTGAKKGGRPGKFELANGGTVFLDEIGEMPLELQAKLLRVLQSRKIARIGGKNLLDIDVKVIAATNRDLEREVQKNNFREDLFYRLNMVQLKIPPLRKRKEDIPLLIDYITDKIKKKLDIENIKIKQKVKELLINYSWPGNVRELENVLYSSVMRCKKGVVTVECLPENIKNENKIEKDCIKSNENVERNEKFLPMFTNNQLKSLSELECMYIKYILKQTEGNKKEAAKILGVSRSTLYRKLKEI